MKQNVIFLGCGYLGYNCAHLLSKSYNVKVWGLDGPYSKPPLFELVDAFNMDESHLKALENAVVIDTLSLFPFNLKVDNEDEYIASFLAKYKGLYDTIKACNIAQYIYMSSGGTVYGQCEHACKEDDPLNGRSLNLYSKSKVMIESLIQESGLPYTIVRLANPFGGYQLTNRKQGVIPVLIECALNQQPFHCWANLNSLRDYIYIEDVVHALSLIIDHQLIHDIYNVGSGRSTSLQEVIDYVELSVGKPIDIIHEASDVSIVENSLLNIDKFVSKTSFNTTVSLHEGIRKEVQRIKGEAQ